MNAFQSHTGSYYAASVNQKTAYTPLEGYKSCDVCVIGAGFTGVSTALHLVERGYSVHLLEANKVGWGASGRNGGQIIGGISGEEKMVKSRGPNGQQLVWDMRWAGHEIIRERVKTYNIDCDLKSGYLDVAIKQRHKDDLLRSFQSLEKHKFPYEYRLLDKGETRDLIGTESYLSGLLNHGNGHVHSLNLCIGEARAAESLGAIIHEQSPVIEIKHGNRPEVVTKRGSVKADFVVLAGNAYHYLESSLRGILLPVNSFILASEPLSDAVVQRINPTDIAVCDPNYILEYFRLSADKRLLFGGRCNYSGSDPNVIKRMLIPRLAKIYPELADLKIDYAWGGTIGVTINRVPQLGRLANNVFYSQGYSGHGVNVTHLAGQIMADAIAGSLERFDMFARIKPIRVPGAHIFARQLVALGMLYYQLKDRI